jgi:hypothetical protein
MSGHDLLLYSIYGSDMRIQGIVISILCIT